LSSLRTTRQEPQRFLAVVAVMAGSSAVEHFRPGYGSHARSRFAVGSIRDTGQKALPADAVEKR